MSAWRTSDLENVLLKMKINGNAPSLAAARANFEFIFNSGSAHLSSVTVLASLPLSVD
jgi:hypothetical protein